MLAGLILPESGFAQTAAAPTTNPNSQLLATNQKSFTIPVSVDRTQPGHQPQEVQLLVSGDQGKTWSTYARQVIDTKGFPFQTRDDGEYWFASRTVDKQGNTRPAGVVVPELKLLLDATPPRIEIDAAVNGSGAIKAAWRITDASLDAQSIQLEYHGSEGTRTWQKVSLVPQQMQPSGKLLTGETSFTPQVASRTIEVRLLARDRAGNTHSETRRVEIPRVAKATPLVPEWPPRFGSAPKVDKGTATGPNYANDPFTSRMPASVAAAPKDAASTTTSQPAIVAPPTAETWPADNKLAESKPPVNPLAKVAERSVVEVSPPVRDGVLAQPATGPKTPLIWPSEAAAGSPAQPPEELQAPAETLPPVEAIAPAKPSQTRVPLEPREPLETRELTPTHSAKLPNDTKPLLSPKKSFALEYDLDAVGPAGVKAVELWVTTDGASSWRKWGEDADKKSPFEIQVESERTFGFRMVIVANNGLATRPPEPGDVADVWVKIDTTSPTVRLIEAAYGTGEHAGQLDIRWQADDEHLGSRPVTLVFSEAPEGPYTTLAAGLPNTGQYYWTIDPRVPKQLYLRLEVRDEAGNLGIDQTTEPVSLEGLAPRGRIRSITPAAASDTRGKFHSPLFR
jgi:hypothetical protein